MRYSLNIEKTINQLVPHFIGGRKLILYLQSICAPLQTVNDMFCNWATEKRIEASMTSQIIMIEWYLNKKFSKYYKSSVDRMGINDSGTDGVNSVPIFLESDNQQLPYTTYQENETVVDKNNIPLHYEKETNGSSEVSFVVCSPAINTTIISKNEYTAMVANVINRYKVAGMTYKILIN